MAYKTVNVASSSISSFTNQEPIHVLGKNGFTTTVGSVTGICSDKVVSGGNIYLKVKGLSQIRDLNHEKHILAVNDGQVNLSLSSIETTPHGVVARPDLSRFYVVGGTNDTIYQFYLTVPGDISTGRIIRNPLSISDKETTPYGMRFSQNGYLMYVTGASGIHQYRLFSAWEVGTARYEKTRSISGQTSTPYGIAFSNDGSKLFICDASTVYYYTFSTPWDINTLTYVSSRTFTAMGQAITATDLIFSNDGKTLYGLTTTILYQYTLTTAYDISTATYASKSLSLSTQEITSQGVYFRSDGLKLYIVGTTGDDLNEYTMTKAWDISTGSFASVSAVLAAGLPQGVHLSSDGLYAFVVDQTLDDVRQYILRTPWTASSAVFANANINVTALTGGAVSGELSVTGLHIPENGGNVYIVGTQLDRVYQFTLNTAFTFDNIERIRNFSLATQDTTPHGIVLSADGSKMYMVGQTQDRLNEYSLSQRWNVESATFTTFSSIGATENTPSDIVFKPDGTKYFIIGTQNDRVYPFNTTTPWSISGSTLVSDQSLNIGSLTTETAPNGMCFSPDGSSLYLVGETNDTIYQINLTTPWVPSTGKYGESSFGGLKGKDYVTLPVIGVAKNTTTDATIGQIGYDDQIREVSVEITSYDLAKDNIVISDQTVNGSLLSGNLLSTPFILKLPQSVDYRYFDARSLYVEGSRKKIVKTYDVDDGTTSFTANLGVKPLGASFVEARLDGVVSSFSLSNFNITGTKSTADKQLRVIIDQPNVPLIEPEDEVTIYDQTTYKVANVSYLSSDKQYNAYLTANSVYRITLSRPIDSRVQSGSTLVNISPNLFGYVGNVNTSNYTFTIDYDETKYPGSFALANNKVYSIATNANFKKINLANDKTLRNLLPGKYIIKTRNKSSYGRVSEYTTQEVDLKELYIGRINDISFTEQIYIDTGQSASVRGIVQFDTLDSQHPIDYEISYKLNDIASLATFNTVKVSKAGAVNGQIRHVINNIDQGYGSAARTITIQVTPLNGDTRGIPFEKTFTIAGKTARPKNVKDFSVRQFQDSLYFSYSVPTKQDIDPASSDNVTPHDIDLNYIDIRRMVGSCTSPTSSDWIAAKRVLIASTPSRGAQAPVDAFGTYTFLVKTVDTSSNETDNSELVYAVAQIIEPTDITITAIFSESDPSANAVSTLLDNNNYDEYYYPSVSNSTNGGLKVAGGGSASNANGTSSGWTQGSDVLLTTIFATGSTANYQTKVRSLNSVVSGAVKVNYEIDPEYSITFNGFKDTLGSFTSTGSLTDSTILTATGIGNYFNGASFSTVNMTLSNAGSSGNVFAIWNTNTDVGNSNSYALIAGVINTNAIKLGNTYFANGLSTGGNAFPNLTTSYRGAFSLVNLRQYSDETISTFEGNPSALSDKIYIRYSDDASIFHANGNIISENFSAWTLGSGDRNTFKHFQLRLDLNNSDTATTQAKLTDFNYFVQLTKRSYQATITMDSNPKTVDYSSAGFTITPQITSIIPINLGYAAAAEVVTSNTTVASIKVYKVSDGSLPTGFSVDFKADGA